MTDEVNELHNSILLRHKSRQNYFILESPSVAALTSEQGIVTSNWKGTHMEESSCGFSNVRP